MAARAIGRVQLIAIVLLSLLKPGATHATMMYDMTVAATRRALNGMLWAP